MFGVEFSDPLVHIFSSAECKQSDEYGQYEDIEFLIPSHTVPKHRISGCTVKVCRNYENTPLLIEDVHNIQISKAFPRMTSIYGVYFKTVTIYGRIAPLRLYPRNETRTYHVDDGTGSVIVRFSHIGRNRIKTISAVNNLDYEVNHFKKHKFRRKFFNKPFDVCHDSQIILRKIKSRVYIPDAFFKLGSKASIIGIPYKTNEDKKVHLWAIEMLLDSNRNRDKEISFKQSVIDFYRDHFL